MLKHKRNMNNIINNIYNIIIQGQKRGGKQMKSKNACGSRERERERAVI